MTTTSQTTALDLEPIKARIAAATDGPWIATTPTNPASEWAHTYDDPMVVDYFSTPGNYVAIAETFRQGDTDGQADADFVAHARTDVPVLIAEVERLRAALAEAQAMAQAFDTPCDSGRVRVFVGDLRHVLHKGLEGGESRG